MVRNVDLRPEAERDTEDIADYTIDQWGHEQAQEYVGDLRRAVERLATSGTRHPEVTNLHPGLRRVRCRHHFIFYLIDDTTVDIVRVLHERMNIRPRLGS